MNRVLLVDDGVNVVNTLARQLSPDYEVYAAESGAEGLEKLAQQGPFAAVVADYLMPGMDGVEFLSQVKERCSSMRILLVGYPELGTAAEAAGKGYIHLYLTKPCQGQELYRAIHCALKGLAAMTAYRT